MSGQMGYVRHARGLCSKCKAPAEINPRRQTPYWRCLACRTKAAEAYQAQKAQA